jgi:hypothetical protein
MPSADRPRPGAADIQAQAAAKLKDNEGRALSLADLAIAKAQAAHVETLAWDAALVLREEENRIFGSTGKRPPGGLRAQRSRRGRTGKAARRRPLPVRSRVRHHPRTVLPRHITRRSGGGGGAGRPALRRREEQ